MAKVAKAERCLWLALAHSRSCESTVEATRACSQISTRETRDVNTQGWLFRGRDVNFLPRGWEPM